MVILANLELISKTQFAEVAYPHHLRMHMWITNYLCTKKRDWIKEN